jgi:hypothetical protein
MGTALYRLGTWLVSEASITVAGACIVTGLNGRPNIPLKCTSPPAPLRKMSLEEVMAEL